MEKSTACVVDGCNLSQRTRQLCAKHYLWMQRHGRLDEFPLPPRPVKPVKQCRVDDCERPSRTLGWCGAHYQRSVRFGDPLAGTRPVKQLEWPTCASDDCTNLAKDSGERAGVGLCAMHEERRRKYGLDFKRCSPEPQMCSVDGCDLGCIAQGLCGKHYQRLRTHGDVNPELRWVRGRRKPGSYVYLPAPADRGIKQIAEHRLVMERELGRSLLPGENVHHINGDRQDNRVENLELWNTAQPAGQRVTDKVAFAVDILKLYAPELLASIKID